MKIKSTIASTLLFALMLMGTSGCAGDPNTLLSDGIWDFEDFTTTSEDDNIKSLVALGKAFMTDATMEFQADSRYIMTSPLSDDPETGTWELVGDDQLIINPDGDGGTSTANIDVLTRKQLSYVETFNSMGGDTYTVTTVWVRD
ncbi:MAG: hypothetical protein P1P82_15850 [Bacteroidales bacterium]|nr:hypothetical protein [Bacteroidales bacterium]MDT8432884.1 hypothetical protein [Bacteroidales bacterium]